MNRKRLFGMVTAVCLILAACVDDGRNIVAPDAPQAHEFQAHLASATELPRYIVRLDNLSRLPAARADAIQRGASIRHSFENTIAGFVANMSPQAAENLRSVPGVVFVKEDVGVRSDAVPPTLDRLDTRVRAHDGAFTRYYSGSGVRIYVLGSGVRYDHVEFGGRVIGGWSVEPFESPFADHTGHETGVASIAAGATFGTAPGASIFSVRFDYPGGPPFGWGDAWLGDMIDAVDWLSANYVPPAVAVMSWGLSNWWDNVLLQSLDDAVNAAIGNGIMIVTSAGNTGVDACTRVPAKVAKALTVSSTWSGSNWDDMAAGANHGPCVDILAPGEFIPMASHLNTTGDTTGRGTSYAAPYVAGVVAQLLQQHPTASPALIHTVIVGSSTRNVIGGSLPAGTPNRFLFSQFSHSVIQGPSGMYDPGNYTWDLKHYGHTGVYGSYAVQWHRLDDGAVTWIPVGSGSTLTMYVGEGECSNFVLRATIDKGYESIQPILVVTPRVEICAI